ncbi:MULTISPECIES: formyltetrahydrofolate deformylase [Pasteurellaceae]|uniref:Formyltetrahydrofolate deformylase n=1 Tax=Pasteurella atlantica TaxID=2827233 RepID=A0AAW8CLP3_9PAST|nr:formyltetrahydrofolate deformylase [Pasteurella atlantica]MBR0573962.1 formyltetrahydrofolate deformylase [Pasteurella atlantica]MDP8039895.1 formyltetrahydrofolate deformylase [Pasteurella atlantica]MDP8042081.1 formyltetrahydrofolate deformylase [Pasteurella atlantica]MDP8044156.1 formyltetrahydrofolate deformylase [Pasteurella atlantica]MDP8046280.1 formyltetrahydrofolate deformylase [Pasteurella atlantica]
MIENKILLTECPDAKGLVSKITNICYKYQFNIIKNNEFVDNNEKYFFMRTELQGIFNDDDFLTELKDSLPEGGFYQLIPKKKKRIVILVTKEAHCLGDILMKNYYGGLDMEIAAVIGNHDTLRDLVERFDIPFHFISHLNLTREQHDKQLADKIDEYSPDYIVLAKYMRVLNPQFVERYPNRVINIHHSFLPAFIGAKPYQQAYERGVKIIGATAHFINNELDQGPIIMQNVINVDHSYTAELMQKAGRDVEKNVLTQALEYVLDDRIFVHNNKTVIM